MQVPLFRVGCSSCFLGLFSEPLLSAAEYQFPSVETILRTGQHLQAAMASKI